jgi:hypothetical protein
MAVFYVASYGTCGCGFMFNCNCSGYSFVLNYVRARVLHYRYEIILYSSLRHLRRV